MLLANGSKQWLVRGGVSLMLIASLTLAVLGFSVSTVEAASPCPPGTSCCLEVWNACGSCIGNCFFGLRTLGKMYEKACWNAQGVLTSYENHCVWDTACGLGFC